MHSALDGKQKLLIAPEYMVADKHRAEYGPPDAQQGEKYIFLPQLPFCNGNDRQGNAHEKGQGRRNDVDIEVIENRFHGIKATTLYMFLQMEECKGMLRQQVVICLP